MQVKTFKVVQTVFLCLSDFRHSFALSPLDALTSALQVDWSRFAYTQYATNRNYLCNSVMRFETLHRSGSRAERLLTYASDFPTEDNSRVAKLLRKARINTGRALTPSYDRVLHLDSDSTLLQARDPDDEHLVAWIEPSAAESRRIQRAIADAGPREFDMEILNTLYQYQDQGQAGTLPPSSLLPPNRRIPRQRPYRVSWQCAGAALGPGRGLREDKISAFFRLAATQVSSRRISRRVIGTPKQAEMMTVALERYGVASMLSSLREDRHEPLPWRLSFVLVDSANRHMRTAFSFSIANAPVNAPEPSLGPILRRRAASRLECTNLMDPSTEDEARHRCGK
ncbi:hypothetical protein BP01DRAFT_420558 [Aspergillus saccharolyticus JOP 1030-1]|uniref:Uncharacterized protein n=1 Tax=Aspergillus saccharolyticus JOP 1030-1 TaxID=1450539 RepID=A0A319AQZ6_9EURO|nr:hypothetical protein BP01DRAFT_420558 [Aspergillus saccharolyticus JOP 1030-1]PYH48812.1 hypothetical protein BP01DRAFT_420558 [Aspergillus saccharolyticus JOP 1030-1]